jgi:putative glycosyltransferase (TIGR04372 family)
MVKLASLRGTLGHLIINTLRYFIEERKEKDLIIISTLKKDISNKFVYKILKNHFENKKVIFINNFLINFVYKVFYSLKIRGFVFFSNLLCNIEWLHHVNPKLKYGSPYNFDEKFYESVPDIKISKSDHKIYNDWKKNKKIKDKFVCISSRDENFYSEQECNPRDSKFSDYDDLIRYLILSNFTVIRMGRKHEKGYNFNDENFLDFYELEKNNKNIDLIECFLFRECSFMVSGCSGIDAYSALFKKKIFIVNHFPAGRKPRYINCKYISQVYQNNNNEEINFNKIPEKILLSEEFSELRSRKISLVKNSPKDILEMIKNDLEVNSNGENISSKKFIIEGKNSQSKICPIWYNKKIKLFK